MTKDQLREFFHQKRDRAKPENIDWAAKRDAWVAAVGKLFALIRDDFLADASSDVEITVHPKTVTERFVGEYQVAEMVLRVGDEQVIFSPKGVTVVGAKGRVDVLGDRSDAMLVWQEEDQWSIVMSRVPTLRLIPLTLDSFAELLKGVMRP